MTLILLLDLGTFQHLISVDYTTQIMRNSLLLSPSPDLVLNGNGIPDRNGFNYGDNYDGELCSLMHSHRIWNKTVLLERDKLRGIRDSGGHNTGGLYGEVRSAGFNPPGWSGRYGWPCPGRYWLGDSDEGHFGIDGKLVEVRPMDRSRVNRRGLTLPSHSSSRLMIKSVCQHVI